jgi:hypothetical protein
MAEWDVVLRLARASLLTASLENRVRAAGVLALLPAPVQAQFAAARVLTEANRRGVTWEVNRLVKALEPQGVPVVLLKGAAYALANLPAGNGRLFNDVDILVPRDRLNDVEQALYWHGWITGHHDAYDQRYYREWMHELPPLIHQKRQSVLDVHHTILPPTARYHPDPDKLRADAIPVSGVPGAQMLAPTDMVIHSACHLFHEGEWDHGLRDLLDLDALLRDFGRNQTFWPNLATRAVEMELSRPLYYALRYCTKVWATPIPTDIVASLRLQGPNSLTERLMDALILRAIAPVHSLTRAPGEKLARFGLYVRSHWLRMPAHLLIPHLLRKAVKPKEV